MPKLSSTYHSRIYQEFKTIDMQEHLSIVRFYEAYEKDIPRLAFSEYFELLIAYADALFEVGAYQSHLKMVDIAIEASILNNIKFYNGKDIFAELLFKKAASCHNLMQYREAEHVLRELLKINPYHELSTRFLKRCLRQQKPSWLRHAQAATIFLFLMSALIIAVEIVFVRGLFPEFTSTIEQSRSTTFLLACFIFAGSDLGHRFLVNHDVNSFIAYCKERKQR